MILLILICLVYIGTWYDFIFLYYKPKSQHGHLSMYLLSGLNIKAVKNENYTSILIYHAVNWLEKILKPFSLISNLERLMKPSQSDEFSIMNGFKFLCILQVIQGHRAIREFGNPQMNNDFNFWVKMFIILFNIKDWTFILF